MQITSVLMSSWTICGRAMDQINKIIGPMRPALQIIAYAVLVLALLKYFNVKFIDIKGEWWQLAILALSVRSL